MTSLSKSLQSLSVFCFALWLVPACRVATAGQFFRVVGPTPVTITALTPDGYITWTSAQIGSNYTVQTARYLGPATNWVDYIQVPASNSVVTLRLYDPNPPFGMVLIPDGSFTMGDTLDGEADAIPTNVYVSAVYMDIDLVTYSLWNNVYQWATNQGYGFDNSGSGKAADHPVYDVNWYDTVKWSNARSQQEGLTPVYYTDAGMTQVYTNREIDALYVKYAASGYRLPTEAEWEKAARGGLCGQRFPWGDTIAESQANYVGCTSCHCYDLGPNGFNSIFNDGLYPYTSPVDYFAPNGYGLYDMAGNLDEWCWDLYGTPYGQPTSNNPTGPAIGSFRMIRGGLFFGNASSSRCANRTYYTIPGNADLIGCRCVRRL